MNKIEFTKFNEVVIMGGGTAGWLTATALSTYTSAKVTLIQPKNNNVIGVGESTQPDLIALLNDAKIDVGEFIKATDATIKCGIYYEDWNETGDNYWHPFSPMAAKSDYTLAHHYQQLILENPEKYKHKDYYSAVHPSYDVCVKHKLVDKESAVALHVDADKMHDFLRSKLKRVEVIEPDTIEVLSGEGKIAAIKCDGVDVTADLFVDCTGFNKLLMKQVSDCENEFYMENVETAIFARIPYIDREKEMVPYTKAHAQKHGWIWTIPLQSRLGSGYVYTRNSCTPQEAEQEFREYWGVERTKDLTFKHLPFNSDALKKPWVGNCLAIGLSCGFVEPLEATGINWIITAAGHAAKLLARGYYDNDVTDVYNSTIKNYVNDVQDFVDVHYKLSKRRDSMLWQVHTSRLHHPRLERKLEMFADQMPTRYNRPKHIPWSFNEVSWIDILNGYQFPFRQFGVPTELRKRADLEMYNVAATKLDRLNSSMTNVEYLKKYYNIG